MRYMKEKDIRALLKCQRVDAKKDFRAPHRNTECI